MRLNFLLHPCMPCEETMARILSNGSETRGKRHWIWRQKITECYSQMNQYNPVQLSAEYLFSNTIDCLLAVIYWVLDQF